LAETLHQSGNRAVTNKTAVSRIQNRSLPFRYEIKQQEAALAAPVNRYRYNSAAMLAKLPELVRRRSED
jgi:hypothetical protein